MPAAHPVFRISDLDSWPRPGTHLAVVGFPIHHSISPDMHQAALAGLARTEPSFATWSYHRFEIHPDDLAKALPLFHAKGFKGLNLTLPHKILATQLISAIAAADRPIGAVNTLVSQENGWLGINTDGQGMSDGIQRDLGLSLKGTPVVLLGAGGAARGAAVQCLREGCSSLTVINRSAPSLDALKDVLAPLCGSIPVAYFLASALPATLPAGALVINATSSGLKESDPLPMDLSRLPRPAAVYDMIYNPTVTGLLHQASTLGLPNANGLSMLVNQGARALAAWSGRSPSVEAMNQAARTALSL